MRLAIMYLADKDHGYGHHYRCQALGVTARALGHDVAFITNAKHEFSSLHDYHIDADFNYAKLGYYLTDHHPDWLIVDLEDDLDATLCRLAHVYHVKVANLNGVGWEVDCREVDFNWIQDNPKTVILRTGVLETTPDPKKYWFVFGGSADPLGLLTYFTRCMRSQPAMLVHTDITPKVGANSLATSVLHKAIHVKDDAILPYMAGAQYACIHLGVLAWEMAYLGVPTYVFSRSESHLRFAQNMERLGLVRAYPQVGLPVWRTEMREFLLQDLTWRPEPQNRPDGKGAERFVKELERRC